MLSPPSSTSPERPARALLRVAHGLGRFIWLCFVLGLGMLLYLWVVGMPAGLTDRLLAHVESEPFQIAIDRLALDPTEGIVASGVYLYRDHDFSEPLARADGVTLEVNWRALLREGLKLDAVRVHDGALRLPAGKPGAPDEPEARVAISKVNGEIRLDRDAIAVPGLSATMFGVAINGTGTVARAPVAPGRNAWRDLAAFVDSLRASPPGVAQVVNELNALRFETPAHANVSFHIDPAHPETWDVQASLEAGDASIRGAEFDLVRAEAGLQGYDLHLPEVVFGVRGHRCHVNADLNLTNRVVTARLYSDLPPAQWIAVMPKSWQRHLRRAGIEVAGTMKSEVWIGPATLDEIADSVAGWVSLDRASVRGVWLESGYCSFAASNQTYAFREISAVVGRSEGRGPLEGEITWDRGQNRLKGDLRATFDPNELLPLLSSNQALVVARFEFPGPPPHFDLHFSDEPGVHQALFVEGTVAASNCAYRGVDMSSLTAGFLHSNGVLTLRPWHFTRPEGETSGWLAMDFSNELYAFDLESTMHPHAIGQLVGPHLRRALSPWRFDGPVHIVARGQVDGHHDEHDTDLTVEAEGQRMGWTNFIADQCSFTLRDVAGRFTTTNVAGTAYAGTFAADVEVHPDAAHTFHFFNVAAAFTNLELAKLAAARAQPGEGELEGRLWGHVVVSGLVEDARGPTTSGHGALSVEHGALFRLPLLGGLSKLLTIVYPGLGFAEQTDFHCTFAIQDGQIVTDDAKLEGGLLSMRAHGKYEFNGNVRFNVEVQLLRRGPIAAVLRFVTMPVTKLLEFQLSGTVADPKWRPVNLPKELFLIFE